MFKSIQSLHTIQHAHCITKNIQVITRLLSTMNYSAVNKSDLKFEDVRKSYEIVNKRGTQRDLVSIKEGDVFYDFKCIKKVENNDLHITAFYFNHDKTNSQYIHIDSSDTDNVFGICVKTPSKDNTGVSHIMEHTTLCGSQKYPVRDPFFKMRNRSLNTFMNAMTGDTYTCYPISTQNTKDYFNLMDVYYDAVFHPLLRKEDFQQESWYCNPETKSIQGVVYDEMKGYFSQPSLHIVNSLKNVLLQNTPYNTISGGHPQYIPTLNYNQFMNFHKQYYHPSNSMFFTYGDLSPLLHIKYLSKQLSSYTASSRANLLLTDVYKPISSSFRPQTQFKYPDVVDFKPSFSCYPIPAMTTDSKELNFIYNHIYPINSVQNPSFSLAVSIFSGLFSSGVTSPLYKNLLSKGYGKSLSMLTCYDSLYSRPFFTYGITDLLSNVNSIPETTEQYDTLYKQCLEEVRNKGFEQDKIDGMLNQLEMSYLEKEPGTGLRLFDDYCKAFSEEYNMYSLLETRSRLNELKGYGINTMMKDIANYLLVQEPYKLFMKDDMNFLGRFEEEEKKNYEKYLNQSDIKITGVNAPEDLSVLPTLSVQDIPVVSPTPYPDIQKQTRNIYSYVIPNQDLVYLTLLVDVSSLPSHVLQILPSFTKLISKVSTDTLNANEMELYLNKISSGLSTSLGVYTQRNTTNIYKNKMLFSVKLLSNHIDEFLSTLKSILMSSKYDSAEGKVLLSNYINNYVIESEGMMSSYAFMKAMSGRHIDNYINNLYNGIDYFDFITNIQESSLLSTFSSLSQSLFSQHNMQFFIRGSETNINMNIKKLESFMTSFPKNNIPFDDSSLYANNKNLNLNNSLTNPLPLGMCISNEGDRFISQYDTSNAYIQYKQSLMNTKNLFYKKYLNVNHTSTVFDGPLFNDSLYPSTLILANILSTKYLHHVIREEGGAYGVSMNVNRNGTIMVNTHSNPHVLYTKDILENLNTNLNTFNITNTDVDEAKLSLFSSIDAPESEYSKGFGTIFEHNNELISNCFRRDLLLVNRESVYEARDKYIMKPNIQKKMCIFGGEDGLKEVTTNNEFTIC